MLIPGKSTLDRSWIAGGVLAGRSPMLFPDDAGTPSIDWDSGRRHAQNGRGKGLQGERNQKSTMADRPQDGGLGNRRPPSQMPLGNWLKSREDGRMKRRAVAGSPALWWTCQSTGWESDEGTRSPTGCRVREMHKPAVGRGRTIGWHLSDLSCFL